MPFFGFAQLKDEYIKGTILLQNKEKKEGFIRNDNFMKMNYKVNFKLTKESKQAITHDTSSIKSVEMDNGEVYDLLRYKPHARKDSIDVLARLVVRGKASLYKVFYSGTEIYIIVNYKECFPIQDDQLTEAGVLKFYYKDYLKQALADYFDLIAKIDKMGFSKSGFINLVKEYNQHYSSESKVVKVVNKSKRFVLLNIDGKSKNANDNTYIFGGNYRVYFPRLSKAASFNVGLQYWDVKYTEMNYFNTAGFFSPVNYEESFLAIPVSLHINFLNKWFRPYCFAGFSYYCFYKLSNNTSQELNSSGGDFIDTENHFFYHAGFGIEADVFKGFMFKSEIFLEKKLITLGLGYHFSSK